MIELISIVVLTFSLGLFVIGLITIWLERGQQRLEGIALTLVGLLIGAGYGFLGSRFSEAIFGELIVRVNLPQLMLTALIYTSGVIVGTVLAMSIFLWATGRFRHRVVRTVIASVVLGILIALIATLIAIALSTS